MATGVFESYERQFSTITADITARIGKIPSLTSTEKKTAIGIVQGNIDEAKELLEQLGVEINDVSADLRPQLNQRVQNYHVELKRLNKDFKKAQVSVGGAGMRSELFGEEMVTSEDHRARLLDSTDRLSKTTDRLDQGYQIAQETEEIGLEIMDNLHRDRETIQRVRGRLRETDADLSRGSRIVRRIHKRILQHKVFFGIGAMVLVAIIGLCIFGVVYSQVKK